MSLSDAEQLVLKGIQLKDDATFRNFFPAKNAHVLNFLQYYEVNSPDWFVYLWGKSSSGRTHLLHAICHQAKQQTAIYLPMSQNDTNHLEPSIFDDLEGYDWVCIDDIHAIINQPKWEMALFNLYNRLHEQGRRLIVTADRPP
ncbi:MAG: DnaA regulatory inactivator Hda, partial [Gammaproteobacteria bacterium]|nr:DnaA regulatory inactivator Hda [Gammaproteobacteria bacterium]